jgi:DNA invertase Pin-like site-specific DNA recombinase
LTILRAYAYVRVSDVSEGGVSPAVQHDEIERFCGERGYAVLEWFEDLDLSAFRLPPEKRPALQQMLRQAEDGGCDVVVFYRIDRFARRVEDHMAMRASLEESGVKVDSVGLPWDDSPEGRFMWDLSASLAALESRRLGKRMRDVHRRIASVGGWHGGVTPFGYQHVGKGLTVDATEAGWLRFMHERYQEGWTYFRIARHLQDAHVQTKCGGEWRQATVRQLLRNAAAAGGRLVDGHLVAGYEPAVAPEVWERTQRLMNARRHEPREHSSRRWLMNGHTVRCGTCGGPLGIRWNTGAYAYHCQRRGDGLCSSGPNMRVALVETYTVEKLLRRLRSAPAPRRDTRTHHDIEGVVQELERATEALTRLTVLLAEGNIGAGEHRTARDRLLAKRQGLERRLEQAVRVEESDVRSHARQAMLAEVSGLDAEGWEAMTFEGRRDLLRLFVARVVVNPRGAGPRVRVEWAP